MESRCLSSMVISLSIAIVAATSGCNNKRENVDALEDDNDAISVTRSIAMKMSDGAILSLWPENDVHVPVSVTENSKSWILTYSALPWRKREDGEYMPANGAENELLDTEVIVDKKQAKVEVRPKTR